MPSFEWNEAQRAIFEVSIREKTNDTCVDKLRDEKELTQLLVSFTDGLETNLFYNILNNRFKQKVQNHCGKGNETLLKIFKKHIFLVLLA